jgi:hypothetical protein
MGGEGKKDDSAFHNRLWLFSPCQFQKRIENKNIFECAQFIFG